MPVTGLLPAQPLHQPSPPVAESRGPAPSQQLTHAITEDVVVSSKTLPNGLLLRRRDPGLPDKIY